MKKIKKLKIIILSNFKYYIYNKFIIFELKINYFY